MFSFLFCFFKPKTAYDVRISDWSSDVCSSDLHGRPGKRQPMSPACAPVPTPGAMKVIGLAGWSGSGKTTLIVQLIPALVRRGLSVSTMKHAHHAFDVDKPGKDSYEHRAAGATEVLVGSARRWALLHELRDEAEPDHASLMRPLTPRSEERGVGKEWVSRCRSRGSRSN